MQTPLLAKCSSSVLLALSLTFSNVLLAADTVEAPEQEVTENGNTAAVVENTESTITESDKPEPDAAVSESAEAEAEEATAESVVAESAAASIKDETNEERIERISEAVKKVLPPSLVVSSVSDSPIPGLYEVILGSEVVYVNEDASYLVSGSIIETASRRNITEERQAGLHMALINTMDESDMLIYEPETESNRSITVFTDISCGYCRRLHQELDTLLSAGVRVRYLLFPRAGLGSQAHKDLESVWCAENPQEALTDAKAGGEITPKTCDNPIEQHVALAEQVGLRGTPLIYLDSGVQVPGYREANVLVEMIKNSQPMAN